jgi:four helix bundle protein
MRDQGEQLKERTKRFALDVLELVSALPHSEPGPTIRRQLTKSATSVAANYRASRRSRSHAEFTSRIGLVAEEADESLYWLELITQAGLLSALRVQKLQREADELVAIFSACVRTARRNRAR